MSSRTLRGARRTLLEMKNTTNGSASRNPKAGLQALLTPANCALILIDHQPFQFAGLRSHDSQTFVNNAVRLAKSAKNDGVPTLLTQLLTTPVKEQPARGAAKSQRRELVEASRI